MSARKIAYNTITQVAGKFLGLFVSSFFLIILAEKLGTTGMGEYTTVVTFVGFFVTLADLGINIIMARELAQNPEKEGQITGEFLGFRLVYSFAIMILAPLIALGVPTYRNSDVIVLGVLIAAITQFILLVNQNFVSVLQVKLQLDRAALAEIVNRLVMLGLIVLGARLYSDPRDFFFYVLWIAVVGAVVNAGITYAFARRFFAIKPTITWSKWQETMVLLVPMGIFTFLGMVHFKADTIMLSLMKSSYDVGIYGYAYKISEIMFTIPIMFIGAAFPRMSALYKENHAAFVTFAQTVFQTLMFITFPLLTGVYLLAPYLTTLLSRQSVVDGVISSDVLRILTIAMALWFFEALLHHVLLIARSYTGLIRNLTYVVILNLVLNYVFIPAHSYYAAAWVTVFSGTLMLWLSYVYCQRTTGFGPRLHGVWPILLATLVMSLVVIWVQQLWGSPVVAFAEASRGRQLAELILYGAVGGIAYIGTLALWGHSSPLYVFLGRVRRKDA